MGFVILKRFDTYLVADNLRLIVHRLSSNNSIELQVIPFINSTQLVVHRLRSLFNFTLTEMTTIVMLPRVRETPMAFMRDYCIIEITHASVDDNEKQKIILQCLIQQYFMRTFTARDQWTSRLLRGIRDYLALIYESIRELQSYDLLEMFAIKALRFYEEQDETKLRQFLAEDRFNFKGISNEFYTQRCYFYLPF